ncbi:MAG TPA: phospho-N-acetylmuramoyl-pentapeptide-transferase [Clostridia bacterium]|nr:phospho-N-acetylmuramoyl-pentapeptide-transferase [Clostridia bacterium]HRX41688.1 phospho-N-acetylmuramoyl-pentapeptide-transferase [Clostridia bacterium]
MWQPFLFALAGSIVLGLIMVPLMRRLKFGQTVREDGPRTHLHKTGIPTMGGPIFIIPIVAISLAYSSDLVSSLVNVTAVVLFAAVGMVDDLIKIMKKDHDGLSVIQKTVLLLLISAGYAVYSVVLGPAGNEVIIPFSQMAGTIVIPPYIYIPFLIIFLYWTTNSANLTDGVDGLASSVSIFIFVFLFSACRFLDAGMDDTRIMLLSAIGAVLGFLLFNAHPARIFMGDTGSMALGALIGVISIRMGVPWIIFLVGIIFIVEALSVVIQVGYYKLTQRRVFKMAPIHHHFELSGWRENKVVVVFCLVTAAGGVLSYWLLGLF